MKGRSPDICSAAPALQRALALALALTLGVCMPLATYGSEDAELLSSAEILAGLQRLGRVGTVLYVAAHPDDENSRLLAWLAGERGLRAVYLSLTRGDGGQNLIGQEQDELLGLLRSHELMAARRIDGAEQRFTRARDFGYSKTTAETLSSWGREAVLADVVRVVREVRPDAIVTRFTPQPPNHGHHMASAELAAEAFAVAADATKLAEPGGPGAWQATRLLHNVTLFNRNVADVRSPYRVDVGTYSPLHGKSWGEIAAASRSQHKSQGFGVAAARGPLPEFFELLGGSQPAGADPFADLPTTWARFAGGAAIDRQVGELVRQFDPRAPALSLRGLAAVRAAIAALPTDNPYRAPKLAEADRLLVSCAGLWFQARATAAEVVPGERFSVALTTLLNQPTDVRVWNVEARGMAEGSLQTSGISLFEHVSTTMAMTVDVPKAAAPSTPYWLRTPGARGLYALGSRGELAQPVDVAPIRVHARLQIEDTLVDVERAVQFLWADPVRGERTRNVEVSAPVSVTPDRPSLVVAAPKPGRPSGTGHLQLTVERALVQNPGSLTATVRVLVPQGWRVEPATQEVTLAGPGDVATVGVQVTAESPETRDAVAELSVEVAGRRWSVQQQSLDYPHVPPLTIRKAAQVQLIAADLALGKRRIGYIAGPGDRVAEALQSVGYAVTVLSPTRLATDDLAGYDAIVVGVRAFNAQPRLAAQLPKLWKWVEGGGRLVVQYHTNSRVGPLTVPLGPYPLEIGRDRVTDETATPSWQDPAAPWLSAPNRLTAADWTGWVQERGLYFAKTWDPRYQAPLTLADPGESPQAGALLVAPYGKGTYIYTGLSFFRQLPAGVSGAFRLMANLLGP